MDKDLSVHLSSICSYFRASCSYVSGLSSSSFLVDCKDDYFAVHVFPTKSRLSSVSHALSAASRLDLHLIGTPRFIASLQSASSWLLLTPYIFGDRLAVDNVPSLFQPALAFVEAFESVSPSPALCLSSTFLDFYQFIASSLSSDQRFMDMFMRMQLRPPVEDLCFVHGDFAPQNFLLMRQPQYYALIDWEYAGLGYLGFDRGWLLSVSSFRGFCDPLPHLTSPNDLYFLRFGYFRMASRLLKRRSSQLFLEHLTGSPCADLEFIDSSLLRLYQLLNNHDLSY